MSKHAAAVHPAGPDMDCLGSMSLVDVLNHEIRTPLAALLGHTEMLQEMDLDISEQAARSIAVIAGAASRLEDLADKISRMADRQVSEAEPYREHADLGHSDGGNGVTRHSLGGAVQPSNLRGLLGWPSRVGESGGRPTHNRVSANLFDSVAI